MFKKLFIFLCFIIAAVDVSFGAQLKDTLIDGDVLITTTNNLGIGTSSVPANEISVLGRASIGDATYVNTAAPTNGLIVKGNVGIATLTPQSTLSVNGEFRLIPSNGTQDYKFTGRTNTLGLQSQGAGLSSNLELYAKDGDATDNVGYVVWGKGVPSDVTSSEYLETAYKAASNTYDINVQNIGGGTLRPMRLYTGTNTRQLILGTGGNVGIGTDLTGASAKLAVIGGNLGVGTITPGTALDVNGTSRMTGFQLTTNPSTGYVMVTNSVGIGTWMAASTLPTTAAVSSQWLNYNVGIYTLAPVGIGTNTGGAKLNILGNVGIGTMAYSTFLSTAPPNGGAIFEGNVGIGTLSASTFLILNGNDNHGININTNDTTLTTSVDYVVVAGGGGGGSNFGGGGGAGGYQDGSLTVNMSGSYPIVVGTGGAGGVGGGQDGFSGLDSSFSTITSTGGGGGGGSGRAGVHGGSGGGGAAGGGTSTGTAGQGNGGGAGDVFASGGGGGKDSGGGTGNSGGGVNPGTSGDGGNGHASSISGASVTYACGGGGGGYTSILVTKGSGHSCGGDGAQPDGGTGGAGVANTGSGGGGGAGNVGTGGAGGKGVVIISYPSVGADGTGGTITHVGGNTIHTFNTSATFVAPVVPTANSRIKFQTNGVTRYTIGDDGVNGNLFKISTTELGTGDLVTVNSSGNVGIGTSAPMTRLSVMGGNVGIGTITAASGRMIILGGNVGIGTIVPGQALSVGTGLGVQLVGIGTTVPQQLCRDAVGRIGYFNGAWASSCTVP